MPAIEIKVMQAISRVSHRPVESLSHDMSLKKDLGLDSLSALELEYELHQSGLAEIPLEELMAAATIGDVILRLESAA